jgi:hypothetical protein
MVWWLCGRKQSWSLLRYLSFCLEGLTKIAKASISRAYFPRLDSNLWPVVYKLLTSTPQRSVCRVLRWSFCRIELHNFMLQLRYSSTWVASHPVMLRKVKYRPGFDSCTVTSVQWCRHCFRARFVVPLQRALWTSFGPWPSRSSCLELLINIKSYSIWSGVFGVSEWRIDCMLSGIHNTHHTKVTHPLHSTHAYVRVGRRYYGNLLPVITELPR